jgi:carotenoid cleavage dioxygenase
LVTILTLLKSNRAGTLPTRKLDTVADGACNSAARIIKMRSTISRRRFLQLGTTSLVAGSGPLWLNGCSDSSDNTGLALPAKQALPQDEQGRWWLSNNYAPVLEERDEAALRVTGAIPRALNGLFVRTGSNMRDTDHWFLGHGMLHGIRLEDGRAAWYRNRYVHTSLREAGIDNLTPTDPVSSYSNVSSVYHAGRLLTLGEIGLPYEIDPRDLSTRGVYDFGGRLSGSMTAHPKIDAVTGELLFFGYGFSAPYLTYHQADAAGKLVRSVDITLPSAPMMHDFAITEDYVVFYDLPVLFSLDLAIAGSNFPFAWSADHVPRMGVMPRAGGDEDIRWFEVASGFIFHTMNAYQDPGNRRRIILDASRIDPPFWENGNQNLNQPSHLMRYQFDLDAGTVAEQQLNDAFLDFGQLDRRQVGRPYRYGYAMEFPRDGLDVALTRPRGIVRLDHGTAAFDRFEAAPGLALDEAIFVPDPDGQGELDGWLMCYAFDESSCSSSLLIIDARDFTGPPVARIDLPLRIPYGFHATWIRDAG